MRAAGRMAGRERSEVRPPGAVSGHRAASEVPVQGCPGPLERRTRGTGPVLAKDAHTGIPGHVIAAAAVGPVGAVGRQHPDHLAEGASQAHDRRAHAHHELERADERGRGVVVDQRCRPVVNRGARRGKVRGQLLFSGAVLKAYQVHVGTGGGGGQDGQGQAALVRAGLARAAAPADANRRARAQFIETPAPRVALRGIGREVGRWRGQRAVDHGPGERAALSVVAPA